MGFPACRQKIAWLLNFSTYLFSLTCSQIWLKPDHLGTLTKLGGGKKKNTDCGYLFQLVCFVLELLFLSFNFVFLRLWFCTLLGSFWNTWNTKKKKKSNNFFLNLRVCCWVFFFFFFLGES
jgi:hypothetical protein